MPVRRQRRSGTPVRAPEAAKRMRTPRRVYSPSPPRAAIAQRAGPSEDLNTNSGGRARGGARGRARGGRREIRNFFPCRNAGSPGGGSSTGGRGSRGRRASGGWASPQPSPAPQMSPQRTSGAASRSMAAPATEVGTAQNVLVPAATLGPSDLIDQVGTNLLTLCCVILLICCHRLLEN